MIDFITLGVLHLFGLFIGLTLVWLVFKIKRILK